MSEEKLHPLKPQRVHLKTDEEVTAEYPDKLRQRQTTLDPHVENHRIEEYVKRDE